MTELTIEVRASAFADLMKTVIPFAEASDNMPALNAVKIESRGDYLVAMTTDRFRIGVGRLKTDVAPPPGFSALIRLDALRSMLAMFKPTRRSDAVLALTIVEDGNGTALRVNQSGGFAFIDASITFPLLTFDYPKIFKLITDHHTQNSANPVSLVGVNAAYFADFRHVVESAGQPLVVRSADQGKPLIVTAGDHFIGAIMPMRTNDSSDTAPEWCEFLTEKPEPARKSRAKSKAAA